MIATATAARALRCAALLVGLAVWSGEARAQFFSVSGSPATMKVTTAIPGAGLTPVTDASTKYTLLEFTGGHHEITAQINTPMPAGITLTVDLAAPSGATSMGPVALSVAAHPVVTNIGTALSSSAITYELSATPAGGVVPVQSRTVTFTLVATP
ncbi:MAG: hypothetical protein ACREN6_13320 [Gemmatimonadaceae bacterium]